MQAVGVVEERVETKRKKDGTNRDKKIKHVKRDRQCEGKELI